MCNVLLLTKPDIAPGFLAEAQAKIPFLVPPGESPVVSVCHIDNFPDIAEKPPINLLVLAVAHCRLGNGEIDIFMRPDCAQKIIHTPVVILHNNTRDASDAITCFSGCRFAVETLLSGVGSDASFITRVRTQVAKTRTQKQEVPAGASLGSSRGAKIIALYN